MLYCVTYHIKNRKKKVWIPSFVQICSSICCFLIFSLLLILTSKIWWFGVTNSHLFEIMKIIRTVFYVLLFDCLFVSKILNNVNPNKLSSVSRILWIFFVFNPHVFLLRFILLKFVSLNLALIMSYDFRRQFIIIVCYWLRFDLLWVWRIRIRFPHVTVEALRCVLLAYTRYCSTQMS